MLATLIADARAQLARDNAEVADVTARLDGARDALFAEAAEAAAQS